MATGKLAVRLANPGGESATVLIQISMDSELSRIEFPENIGAVKAQAKPAWDFVGEALAQDGAVEPKRWETDTTGGFFQSLPADPGLAFAYAWKDARTLVFTTGLGEDETAVKNRAESIGSDAIRKAISESEAWWKAYFSTKPTLTIPDQELSDAYLYSLVKLAGLTAPAGVAASLVGPFMDDDTLPAWGNDYHFNINAQMIYWPVLGANCCDHLWPLWKLMLGWLPEIRKAAEKFYGVPGALMLPCGVSDRCQVAGSFWEGLIDVGCVAWMGQLAWLHYRHTLDVKVLEEVAWPLMAGAFESFYASAERIEEDGKSRLSLPVSVSPEYASAKGNWGRDSSFFLAGFHMMAQLLPQAARVLGKPEDPRWKEVEEDLPPYCTIDAPDLWDSRKQTTRLALWKGQDYEESHRHHSMLAAIYPFRTLDPQAPEHRELLARSLQYLLSMGAGKWAGWTLPWTSSICSYGGMPDGAIFWLKYDLGLYFNAGGNSDHNADFVGVNLLARDYILNPKDRYRAAIQSDASMGIITALYDLCVQTLGDRISVLPALPRKWRDFAFDGILTEGAFRIGATVKDWRVTEIRIESVAASQINLKHGLGDAWTENGTPRTGAMLSRPTVAGEIIILRPA